ncbi:DNA-3-methyladenine glycosylase [Legionella oakridgensis ATCC 33761 = DSM 21215]|uniref:Putative 3-methyladenine DNA glycosylase n=3 Tax=Legionella oakridgensis TaxID=29423 RepID=W0BE79_9GAMM|nr:DNA-3-methyladenine glycosylase [Legionella oakridgensis ATCC 33761 = DSM 21215]ETO93300.1 DNA-3-methyladenine glycosylase [Legionella oakridgensis RV-2-2007]KTD37165.1 3-methyladenine DNA glycosylase [Legionella oakridgensis]STY20110.1 DNA-3-methyladenine glycosylase [Legionella longbeachae]
MVIWALKQKHTLTKLSAIFFFNINVFMMQKLNREFYNRDTVLVAQGLLGKLLVHQTGHLIRIGRIVEVEAYLGSHDLAAHSAKGITKRTQVMFGPPGYAYVYLIYGLHYCMNVVTEEEGNGCAVLLRALEPVVNIDSRTQGPGLLCKAMDINKKLNGHDLLSDDFFIAAMRDEPSITIVKKPRIGVSYAKHWARRLLRFYIKGNSFVSKP